jgi:hypothetical protein
MPIKIYKTPQRNDVENFSYSVAGETLTVTGTDFDLSGVTEPQLIDSDFVAGPVFRQGGDIHVQLVIPYALGEEACEHEDMPTYDSQTAEPVTVVYGVDLVGAAMAEQPFRVRKIFETANSYRSDHELWPLLVQIATTLFGEERAAEILAPST